MKEPNPYRPPDALSNQDEQPQNTTEYYVPKVNMEVKDNLLQLACITAGLLIGPVVGSLAMPNDRGLGAIIGGVSGLLGSLFISGLALMYRPQATPARLIKEDKLDQEAGL